MTTDMDERDALRDLALDVVESAKYLGELGVETIETNTSRVAKPEDESRDRVYSAALERHAFTERSMTASSRSDVAGFNERQSDRKTVRPTTSPTDAGAALFGDIAPTASLSASHETVADIHRDIGPDCPRCPLQHGRTRVVHTEGNWNARLMFVGEAPGADEDAQGRPFVGRAGQLLNKIIEAIGFKREEVLIGNINRCRPPENRTPTTEEAKACRPFLLREISIARPSVIVVLGNTAMRNLLDTRVGISRLRGQFQDYYGIKVMPTFHPAYLLRDPSKKREVWDDMKKVRDYLNEVEAREN